MDSNTAEIAGLIADMNKRTEEAETAMQNHSNIDDIAGLIAGMNKRTEDAAPAAPAAPAVQNNANIDDIMAAVRGLAAGGGGVGGGYAAATAPKVLGPPPLPEGIEKQVIHEGSVTDRQYAKKGWEVCVNYDATLDWDGSLFDSTYGKSGREGEPRKFALGRGQVIRGLDLAAATMKRGEKARFTMRPGLAYGKDGDAGLDVPAEATVHYEVELLGWVEKEDLFGDGGCIKVRVKEGEQWKMPKYLDEVVVSYKVVDGAGEVVEEKAEVEHIIGSPDIGPVTVACDAALKTMRSREVVSLECSKAYLWGGESGKPQTGTIELTLHEIYETRDVSFCKDASLLKKQIREGEGFDRPRDLGEVTLKVSAMTDGQRPLEGFQAKTLTFQAGAGEVCDALEFSVLEMRKGERARVDCTKPESCVEAQLGITEPPVASKVVLHLELEDFKNGREVHGMTAEEKIDFATKRKEAAAAFFKSGRLELAMERYKKIVELFSFVDKYKAEVKEQVTELRKLCHLNIAACRLKLQHYDEAKVACGEALREDENNVKALFRRARAHVATNDINDAILDTKKALVADPQNKEARELLQECRDLQKDQASKHKEDITNMIKGLSSPAQPAVPPRPDQETFNRLKDLISSSKVAAEPQCAAPVAETMSKVQAAISQELPTPDSLLRAGVDTASIQEENFAKIKALIAKAEKPADLPDVTAKAQAATARVLAEAQEQLIREAEEAEEEDSPLQGVD
mmetsp:Transcript_63971/g.187669  ORF Transcript_63971/g.187669 Transcript_63971/m.187669 type:complete len:741 (+) Transcript_63971:172-2394(+)